MNKTEPSPANSAWKTGITMHSGDVAGCALGLRIGQALEQRQVLYPIRRRLRFAANEQVEALFDRLAEESTWRTHRPEPNSVLLDGDGFFVEARGTVRAPHACCVFHILAASLPVAEAAASRIKALLGPVLITEPTFAIEWHFVTGSGMHHHAVIHELANDVLHDRAYPVLREGVRAFIDGFLAAPEAILVLQGPPGTGKTRLIRAILGTMARRDPDAETSAMFTSDDRALTTDEFFVNFVTGHCSALVIEDADHLLRPRASGNECLHRFLTVADGVVRAQGRKIIFSTNLPNIGDLDDALIRPGRCHAHVRLRPLELSEAEELFNLLRGESQSLPRPAFSTLASGSRSHALADIYRAVRPASR